MSPLFRVRLEDGTEGDVLMTSLGEYAVETQYGTVKTTGFVGLLKLDDKTLSTRPLEGASVIVKPPVPLPVPMPATSIPSGGKRGDR